MARNVALQILRGPQANMPALNDGEFYLAEDTGQLWVGFNGGTLKVGNVMPIQLSDGTIQTQLAKVDAAGNQYFQATSLPLPLGAAQDGVDATGVTGPPGAVGIRGWLSALFSFFEGQASVKQTQSAALYINVQEPKDCGRSKVILSSTKVTAITSEALLTLTQKKGDAATTTGTSYTVTAGKTLRLQSLF